MVSQLWKLGHRREQGFHRLEPACQRDVSAGIDCANLARCVLGACQLWKEGHHEGTTRAPPRTYAARASRVKPISAAVGPGREATRPPPESHSGCGNPCQGVVVPKRKLRDSPADADHSHKRFGSPTFAYATRDQESAWEETVPSSLLRELLALSQ